MITKEDATIAYYGFPDKETMKIANNINISTYKEYEIHLKNKKEEDKNKKEEDEKIKQNELKLKQELDIKRHNEEYERSKNKPKEEKFIPGDENNIIIIPGQSPMTLKECRNKGICPMAR